MGLQAVGPAETKSTTPDAPIWSMCFGLLGVQVVWALQNGNTSRIFQSLGADVEELALLWIAAPITGLLVQPIIGHLSDRTWGGLGRRRPYLLAGALMTAAALVLMPNTRSIFGASIALWLLTASVNVAAEPFRALVADMLPPERRATGYAAQVFFLGLGAVLASAMPWILVNWFGVEGRAPPGELPLSVRWSFYLGALVIMSSVGWTVLRVRERPPEDLLRADRFLATPGSASQSPGRGAVWWSVIGGVLLAMSVAAQAPREIQLMAAVALAFGLAQVAMLRLRWAGRPLGLLGVVQDIIEMPGILRRLAAVQFLTWFALFAMWVYAVPAVAARHYATVDPTSAAFGRSADWVGVLFAEYNAVAAVAALLLPRCASLIGQRALYAAGLLAGAAGLAGFVSIDNPRMLWVPTIGIGVAWAVILSLPYAMLAEAVPARKVGVYMGIHNIFLVLPQLAAAASLGPLLQALNGQAVLLLAVASGSMAGAAMLAFVLLRGSSTH